MVEHTKNIRIMAYFCAVVLLPVYSALPFLLGGKWLPQFDTADLLTMAYLVFIFTFCSILGAKYSFLLVRFLTTLKIKIDFDEQDVTTYSDDGNTTYSWQQLANSKRYSSCQILCIKDQNNKHVVTVWEYAKNYQEFNRAVIENIGI